MFMSCQHNLAYKPNEQILQLAQLSTILLSLQNYRVMTM